MGTPRLISIVCATLAAGCALTSLALPLRAPVRSIESANQISGWEQVDNQHVVLRFSPQDQYLLTLRNPCLGLNWGRNVGVTMSNNTIWAGFDAITVDGNQCEIETIHPLGTP